MLYDLKFYAQARSEVQEALRIKFGYLEAINLLAKIEHAEKAHQTQRTEQAGRYC